MEIELCDGINEDDHGEDATNDNNKAISCPLFMDGLPSDFSTNPALAAIASLMTDSNRDAGDDAYHTTQKLSTKKIITKRNERSKYKPYIKDKRRMVTTRSDECVQIATSGASPCEEKTSSNSRNTGNKTSATTVGEASLFLKMWKL
jgi:hypothetical protein